MIHYIVEEDVSSMTTREWTQLAYNVQGKLQKYGDITVDLRILKSVMKDLTDRQRSVVLRRYQSLDTISEISEALGIGQTRVYNIIKDFNLKVFIRTDKNALSDDNLWLLYDKGLSARIIYALRRASIYTISDLNAWVTSVGFESDYVRNIGPKSKKAIKAIFDNMKD